MQRSRWWRRAPSRYLRPYESIQIQYREVGQSLVLFVPNAILPASEYNQNIIARNPSHRVLVARARRRSTCHWDNPIWHRAIRLQHMQRITSFPVQTYPPKHVDTRFFDFL